MKLCAHCGQAIVGPVPQPTIVQPNNAGAAPLTAFVEYHVPAANAAAGGFPPLRIYDFTVHAGRAIFVLMVLAASLAFADAPAPVPSPKPRPRVVASPAPVPVVEPLDLPPVDVPGFAQPDTPVAVPVAPADDPAKNPCGTELAPKTCVQLDTGYQGVITRGEKRDYLTGGLSFLGPLPYGLTFFTRAEILGIQDGGRLTLNPFNPQSFRAITTEAAVGKVFFGGKAGLSLRGATTFSIEGKQFAPIDPRLWTGRLEFSAKLGITSLPVFLRQTTIRLRGGHEGTVGGWAFGGDLEIPIPNAPAFVSSYDVPLYRPTASAPLPWVLTAGARATFGRFRLASLFQ